jgi:thioredoxin 1
MKIRVDSMYEEDFKLEKIKMKKLAQLMNSKKEEKIIMSDQPTILNSKNFDEIVIKSKVPVLVDFYADWCMPCKMMAPIIDNLAKKYNGKVLIGKVNVDENSNLAMKYQTMSIPTFIIFKNGEPVDRKLGTIGAQLEQVLLQHI